MTAHVNSYQYRYDLDHNFFGRLYNITPIKTIFDMLRTEWHSDITIPSLSELTPMIFNMGLTHLGSETSK